MRCCQLLQSTDCKKQQTVTANDQNSLNNFTLSNGPLHKQWYLEYKKKTHTHSEQQLKNFQYKLHSISSFQGLMNGCIFSTHFTQPCRYEWLFLHLHYFFVDICIKTLLTAVKISFKITYCSLNLWYTAISCWQVNSDFINFCSVVAWYQNLLQKPWPSDC